MKTMIRLGLAMGLMLTASSAAQAQLLADDANIKVLKARAQLLTTNKDSLTDKLNSQGQNIGGRVECGSVDIGNDFSSTNIGRDITVVITGDIINTDNRCIDTDG
ncbi:MAG: hypothetical protein ACPG80_01970 [Rickettsiales bacterium]